MGAGGFLLFIFFAFFFFDFGGVHLCYSFYPILSVALVSIPLSDVGNFFLLSRYTIHLVHVIWAVVGHCMTTNGRAQETADRG